LESGSSLETEWSRLREQIRLVPDRFWFGIVVADPISAAVLLDRATGELALAAKQVVLIDVSAPKGFDEALTRLSEHHPGDALIWLTGFGLGPDWKRGWSTFLARLNERRDRLTREFQCGLVLVGDEGLNELVRDSATDLWSVSSLTAHVARTRMNPDSRTFADQNLSAVPRKSVGVSNFELLVSQPIAESLRRAQRALAINDPAQALEIIHRRLETASIQTDRAALFAAASRASFQSGDLAAGDDYAARALATPLALGKRDQLILWDRRQEFAFAARRLRESLASAQTASNIARELAEAYGTVEAQKDYALALDNLARVHFATEDAKGALVFSQTSLNLRQNLANTLGTIQAQRDLSVSLNNIALVEMALGQPTLARERYRRSLEIAREVLSAGRTAETMRDLAIAHINVARTDAELGNPTGARLSFLEALELFSEVRERMSTKESQRDLAITFGNIGDLELSLGSFQSARVNYQSALKIAEHLTSISDTIEAQGDLSHALRNLGRADLALGRPTHARDHYQRALEIALRLADSVEIPWYSERAALVARELTEVLNQSESDFEADIEVLALLAQRHEKHAAEMRTRLFLETSPQNQTSEVQTTTKSLPETTP
jgi:tetratricopeptide (TPR) repeat protein